LDFAVAVVEGVVPVFVEVTFVCDVATVEVWVIAELVAEVVEVDFEQAKKSEEVINKNNNVTKPIFFRIHSP